MLTLGAAKANQVSRVASLISIGLGSLVIVGSFVHQPVLSNLFSGLTMRVNAAIGFIGSGLALSLLTAHPLTPSRARIAAGLATFVGCLGALSLFEYVFEVDLGIDQLVFTHPPDQEGVLARGRMAPNTAAAFMLIAGALLTLDLEIRGNRPADYLALGVGIIAWTAACDHTLHPQSIIRLAPYRQMAIYTSLACLALSAGVLFARPGQGLARTFTAEAVGGVTARRLMPAVFVIPVLLGWLRLKGERAGLYDTAFGVSLMATATVLLFGATILGIAKSLNRQDLIKRALEEEQLKTQEDLRVARDAAEANSHELEAFSYSVSHDLRSPLRSIDGFSQALLEDSGEKLDAEGKDHLNRVRAAAQRMSELIDDMLQLSKVTRAEYKNEKVDLSALAHQVAGDLSRASPDRVVRFDIEKGLTAQCDGRLVRLVIENLFGNAWKFTSKRPSATIRFGGRLERALPCWFVQDDGAGFDMAYAGKLFGAFQRLHPAADFEGTGIGLATVQRVVLRHGGRVWAEGKVGEGATFSFTLAPQ